MLIYAAVAVLRSFAGEGAAGARSVAGKPVLGTFNLPIIHYSVQKGRHSPGRRGQGRRRARVSGHEAALLMGFISMTLFAVVLLWSRAFG